MSATATLKEFVDRLKSGTVVPRPDDEPWADIVARTTTPGCVCEIDGERPKNSCVARENDSVRVVPEAEVAVQDSGVEGEIGGHHGAAPFESLRVRKSRNLLGTRCSLGDRPNEKRVINLIGHGV